MKKVENVIWGILLIVVGCIFALNLLGITDIDVFFDGWWTLFIIIPSLFELFKSADKTGSIIWLIIGVLLLLSCRDVIAFSTILKLIFPGILVCIGVSIIIKSISSPKVKANKKLTEYTSVFSDQKFNIDDTFDGAEINAVFGGLTLDLSKSKIKDGTIINSTAVFGGIDIILPANVKLKISSTPIFGGITNKRDNPKKDSKTKVITVYLNTTNIFGGTTIK